MNDDTKQHEGEPNARRDFMKTIVTAVAGLAIAGQAGAEAVPESVAPVQSTVSTDTQQQLAATLDAYASALRLGEPGALQSFFSTKIDFRSTGRIARSWTELVAELANDDLLYRRADGFITHVKWLAPDLVLVDGNFPNATGGRAWFTEVWRGTQSFTIDLTRLRSGGNDTAYRELEALPTGSVPGDLPNEVTAYEEGLLRNNFVAFRSAFNAGDVKGVIALTTGTIDAIPMFSFLDGRAQILTGEESVTTKAARMLGEPAISVETGSTTTMQSNALAARATYIAGEPKIVRFLSPGLAVVDGTAVIDNIPSAHEFAPKSMRGIYSTVWTKAADQWKAEATRPWF